MLYYFAALMAAAAVVWLVQVRHATNRWAALFLVSAAIGGTSEWLDGRGWLLASGIVQFVNLTCTPYAVLVFSLVYAERLDTPGRRRGAKLLLLIPVLATAAWTTFDPPFAIHYPLLAVWAGVYYLGACFVLLDAWRQEKDRRMRRSRFITSIIMTPTLLAVYGLIYIGRAAQPDFPFFGYVSIFVSYSLGIALLCSFVYSVLGVRLRVEHDPLEPALQAASSGAAMLNHTIKNELGKIAISAANLRRESAGNETAEAHLRIIDSSSEHMLAMVSRIHGQMKELSLQLQPCRLDTVIEDVLSAQQTRLESAGIDLTTSYGTNPQVLADPVHLREAVSNVVANSIEAMPDGGQLDISVEEMRRQVRILIRDTGNGLTSAQSARVFEPFFSTKGSADNYGLGLSYVYKVMAQSGGRAELASRQGEGTTVMLTFPRART
ncbi:ATP-binding protein [Paenibacillus sp. 1P07SE]|uniref:sensor histidine kinase n=1 Tax=Paenibacillus sp. 1P07SE TaxID=3132209 RepID=UPI0039A61AD5